MSIKIIFYSALVFCLLFLAVLVGCYQYVNYLSRGRIYSRVDHIPEKRVGLLLGTNPISRRTGTRNTFYLYRITAAANLYKAGKISRILVSGDNHTKEYNEPECMKRDLMAKGVPEQHIYLDYAGFRTLDSVVRAKKVFGLDGFTVISQEFHNRRAIAIARWYGVDAIGFNAQKVTVNKGFRTRVRECFARVKFVLDMITGKQPHFLGEPIPIR